MGGTAALVFCTLPNVRGVVAFNPQIDDPCADPSSAALNRRVTNALALPRAFRGAFRASVVDPVCAATAVHEGGEGGRAAPSTAAGKTRPSTVVTVHFSNDVLEGAQKACLRAGVPVSNRLK